LCRRSGSLDPRTLTALEKGRIRNPSLKTMETVAAGLGLKVSDLFSHSEMLESRVFEAGTQKGFFQIDFQALGIKVVSFTPMIQDFFCGKFIFGSRKRLENSILPAGNPVLLSVLVGRFEVKAGDSAVILKEGENLFLKGGFAPVIQNLLERESAFLAVTAPSFMGLRQKQGMPIFTRKR
jgi:transcriptional regulator with XRE-family HTH domain